MSEQWFCVARVLDLAPGGHAVYEVEGQFIAVYRVGGEIFAVEDQCSHDGAPLDGGKVEGFEVICPRHGAHFCLRTGAALTPPAYAPIRVYPVREAEGQLWINVAQTES